MFSYIAVACLLGVAASAPSGYSGGSLVTAVDSMSIPRYGFNYAVNDPMTGDSKSQSESRDGGVVRGSYSLSEADGTLRVVEYVADPVSGFNAVVKRVGQAAHPQTFVAQPIVTKQLNTGASALVAPVGAVQLGGLGGMGGMGGLGGLGAYGGLDLGHGSAGLGLGGLGYGGLGLGGLGHDGLGLGGYGLGSLGGLGGYGGGKH